MTAGQLLTLTELLEDFLDLFLIEFDWGKEAAFFDWLTKLFGAALIVDLGLVRVALTALDFDFDSAENCRICI